MQISKNRWEKTHLTQKRLVKGQAEIYLPSEQRWEPVEFAPVEISPIYGKLTVDMPWEGNCKKKPWHYSVTAVIPCLNTSETLPVCIELLRLQTVRPFIILIDTGSVSKHLEEIISLRAEDVEVHSIALNGVRHPSDYPAMAMDLAMTLCRTEYLFATHADCFLRKRTLIEEFVELCRSSSPVVGYELSPRAHHDWEGMVSHTASMYHMPVMDRIGFGWSLRRLCNDYGIVDYKPDPMRPNWPDTEILGNYILRKNGILPHLVGKENNQCRTLDENIDHFRSYTAGKMYSPPYFEKVRGWYELALKEARKRIEEWKNEENTSV
jgi:hypothetical protein